MRILTCSWVLPITAPPIPEGAVAVEGEELVAVGPADEILARYAGRCVPLPPGPGEQPRSGITALGEGVLLPALVNAHTHLELCWMRSERLPRGDFMAWLAGMIGRRTPTPGEIETAIGAGIGELRACGTALVGDVGNRPLSPPRLEAAGLGGRFFLEVLGERPGGPSLPFEEACRLLDTLAAAAVPGAVPPLVRASVVPHAPHTVPRSLLRRIAERARKRGDTVSVHAAESAAEDEFLRRGTGPFRALMELLGTLPGDWAPPGRSPIELLDEAGLLGPGTLAVHCVHATRDDARLLAARGATAVLCPRSNTSIGVGAAPVGMLLGEGVRLALGTDSHASNDDLDLLSELAALRSLAPALPPTALARAATLGGAEALGLGSQFGSIEPGKRAVLVLLRRRGSASPAGAAPGGVPGGSREGGGTAGGRGRHAGPAPDPEAPTDPGAEQEPWATLFAGSPRIAASFV